MIHALWPVMHPVVAMGVGEVTEAVGVVMVDGEAEVAAQDVPVVTVSVVGENLN